MLLRACVFLIAAFSLASCDQVSNSLARIGAPNDVTGQGIRTLSLLGGDVRARGPNGYCVDQGASNARSGFVVLAGCALMADDVAIMPSLDGLITIQFGDENTASVTGNEAGFATFLNTQTGRSLLSRNGDDTSVSEVSTITDETAVLVRFDDASGPIVRGTSGSQWRGFLDIKGRLATVSVLSFNRAPLSASESERLLVVAMAELAEVNAPDTAE